MDGGRSAAQGYSAGQWHLLLFPHAVTKSVPSDLCVHARTHTRTLSKNAHSALIAVAACLHNFYF